MRGLSPEIRCKNTNNFLISGLFGKFFSNLIARVFLREKTSQTSRTGRTAAKILKSRIERGGLDEAGVAEGGFAH